MALTLVKASCLCGLNTYQIPFATSKLPLASGMCHCDACRHSTGVLAVHNAPMDGAPLTADSTVENQTLVDFSSPETLAKVKAYIVEDGGRVSRYFCTKCSAHILYAVHGMTMPSGLPFWMVSTGSLERVDGIVKVGYHCNVEDTRDGGLADFYRVVEGVEVLRYAHMKWNETVLPQGWKADSLIAQQKEEAEGRKERKDHLELYCQCKTVSLRITQATAEEAADPVKWWAVAKQPEDIQGRSEKHMCGHCLCTSCRLSSGAIVSSVLLLDKAHITDAHTGLRVSFIQGAPGHPAGLVRYKSSEYVYRESCGTCGASVFYWNVDPSKTHLPKPDADGQPVLVDVYAGLVDQAAGGGARAEEWLHWYDQVMNVGDAIDKPGLEALVEGVKAVA